MSTTRTQTYFFRLEPTIENAQNLSADLQKIQDKYAGCLDDLSKALRDWLDETQTIWDGVHELTPDVIERSEERLSKLFQTILIFPWDRSTLDEPVIVNGRVWPHWVYEDYKAACNDDPHYLAQKIKHPLGEAIVHGFATELLLLFKAYNLEMPDLSQSFGRLQRNLATNAKGRPFRITVYQRFAEMIIKIERLQKVQLSMEEQEAAHKEQIRQMKASLQRRAEQTEARFHAHEEKVDQRIHDIEVENEEKRAEIIDHLEEVEEELGAEKQKTEQARQEGDQLRDQFNNLNHAYQQKQEEVQRLAAQTRGSGGFCTIL